MEPRRSSSSDIFTPHDLVACREAFLLACRAEGKTAATLSFYSGILSRFAWFAGREDFPSDPARTTIYHLRVFLDYVATATNRWGSDWHSARSQASPATIQAYYRVLKTFFGWLQREGVISEDPTGRLKRPRVPRKVLSTFSDEQIAALLRACGSGSTQAIRDRAMLLMLVDSGLRSSELVHLTLEDVDLSREQIRVRGKGRKERLLHLRRRSRQALGRYLARRDSPHPEVFIGAHGEPMRPNALQLLLRRLAQRISVEGVRCSPHTFRHTFAVNFLRNGGNAFDLQYLLGHASLEMVHHYLQTLGAADAAQAHRRFSPADLLSLR